MNGNLTETVKVRLDRPTREELEQEAEADDRKAGSLARTLIREGLDRRRAEREAAKRGD